MASAPSGCYRLTAMGTLGHTSREGLGECVWGCPAVRGCLDRAQSAAPAAALCGTRTALGSLWHTRRAIPCPWEAWDTARSGDVLAYFSSPAESALVVVPKCARGAITDIKEASRLTSGKAWLGSRRSEIAAAAKHSQNPLCLLQLSDRYRDAPQQRAYRDAPHASPWAES